MVRVVARIRDVGCAHPGFAPYLARIRCPKVRCVHPSKWPFWLRAPVPKTTLACIRFRNDPCVHLFSELPKTIIWIRTSETLVFATGFLLKILVIRNQLSVLLVAALYSPFRGRRDSKC